MPTGGKAKSGQQMLMIFKIFNPEIDKSINTYSRDIWTDKPYQKHYRPIGSLDLNNYYSIMQNKKEFNQNKEEGERRRQINTIDVNTYNEGSIIANMERRRSHEDRDRSMQNKSRKFIVDDEDEDEEESSSRRSSVDWSPGFLVNSTEKKKPMPVKSLFIQTQIILVLKCESIQKLMILLSSFIAKCHAIKKYKIGKGHYQYRLQMQVKEKDKLSVERQIERVNCSKWYGSKEGAFQADLEEQKEDQMSEEQEDQCQEWKKMELSAIFQLFNKKYFKKHIILELDSGKISNSQRNKVQTAQLFQKYGLTILFTKQTVILIKNQENKTLGVKFSLQQTRKTKERRGTKGDLLRPVTNVIIDQLKKARPSIIEKISAILEDCQGAKIKKSLLINLSQMIKTPIVLLKFTKSVHLVRFLKKMNQIGCIPMLKLNAHIYEGSIRQECGSEEQPWETETLSDYVLIQMANRQLRSGSLFGLRFLWQGSLAQRLRFCLKNLDVYGTSILEELTSFLRLVEYKIAHFKYGELSLYEQVSRGIQNLAQELRYQLERRGEISGNPRDLNNQEEKEDQKQDLEIGEDGMPEKLLDLYIKEKEELKKSKNPAIVISVINKRRMTLHDFIQEYSIQFELEPELRDLFSIIDSYKKAESESVVKKESKTKESNENESQKKVSQEKLSFQQKYMKNIAEERVVDSRCLGCSTFFYHWMPIVDESISIAPVRAFSSVQRMREDEQEIKDELCTMLNSGGGVILFDCFRDYEKLRVRGCSITEKDKQLYEQRFTSYLDIFQPKVEAKKSIRIYFVPVFQDPFKEEDPNKYSTYAGEQGLRKPHQLYKTRACMLGTYVMRIRVCPVSATTVFYWNQNTNMGIEERYKNYVCTTKRSQGKVNIKMKNIRKEIKKKMESHYLPEDMSSAELRLISRPFTCFDHDCRIPEAGLQINQEEQNHSKNLRQLEKGDYAYTSLLLTKACNHAAIIQLYKSQKIPIRIQEKFQKYRLKAANQAAIMYHNTRFQKMQATSKLHKLKFGKPIVMISITNYLKLINRKSNNPFPLQAFRNLVQNIRQQFKDEFVKLFEFKINHQKEYYLECESNECTLFAYYLLSQQNEKTHFNNPAQLDKMSEEERRERFVLLNEDKGSIGSGKVKLEEKQKKEQKGEDPEANVKTRDQSEFKTRWDKLPSTKYCERRTSQSQLVVVI